MTRRTVTRRTALWLIAALLGIVASAAVAWTASRLAAQRIGLSSTPHSVVQGLAPETLPVLRGSTGHAHTVPSTSHARLRPLGAPMDDSGVSSRQEHAGPDD